MAEARRMASFLGKWPDEDVRTLYQMSGPAFEPALAMEAAELDRSSGMQLGVQPAP
jgi:hypothetical protein